MKVIEWVLEKIICERIAIDDLYPDANYAREVHWKEQKAVLCLAFVDLEKAFDRVPHDVLWWATRNGLYESFSVCTVMPRAGSAMNLK